LSKNLSVYKVSGKVMKAYSVLISEPLSCLCNYSIVTGTFPGRLQW